MAKLLRLPQPTWRPSAARHLIGELQRENKWVRHRLDVLSRRLFGKTTEQLTPDQLTLAYERLDSEIDEAQSPEEPDSVEATPAEKTRPRRGRRAIPKSIRRIDVVVDIPEEEKTCTDCGVTREQIGEDVSEKCDDIPAEPVCQARHGADISSQTPGTPSSVRTEPRGLPRGNLPEPLA